MYEGRIAEHFGLSTWTSWTQIHPLVEIGKLKQEHPNRGATSDLQRLTTPESLMAPLTDESLKKFCIMPRSRAEIIEHFDIESQRGRRMIAKKVREGILMMTKPESTMCQVRDLSAKAYRLRVAYGC